MFFAHCSAGASFWPPALGRFEQHNARPFEGSPGASKIPLKWTPRGQMDASLQRCKVSAHIPAGRRRPRTRKRHKRKEGRRQAVKSLARVGPIKLPRPSQKSMTGCLPPPVCSGTAPGVPGVKHTFASICHRNWLFPHLRQMACRRWLWAPKNHHTKGTDR